MGGEDEYVAVSPSSEDISIIMCGAEVSDGSGVVVMDTQGPVAPQGGG